jgi:hypothetical protein
MNHSTLITATFLLEGYIGQMRRRDMGTELEVGDRALCRGTSLNSKENDEVPQCEEPTNIRGMQVGFVARLP